MAQRERLRGSIVPLVTPFVDGQVDFDAFERAVDRQAAAASDGVVVTGTTGEPTSLTLRERGELFRRAVAVADGRLVVVAATGSANHEDTLALTRDAEQAGVDAVLAVCPPFVRPSQEGLVRHFVAVASSTGLPILIYNIPGRAAVGVTTGTVARVAELSPNLVGLKHASNDLDLVTELLLELGDDFRLFCGLESYSYPFLIVGGAGLMSAVGNLLPSLLVELCDAVAQADLRGALALHRALFPISQAIFFETNPVPLKALMAAMGYGSEEVRLPLAPPAQITRRRLKATVSQLRALNRSTSRPATTAAEPSSP